MNLKIILGCVAALALGIATASPLLIPSLSLAAKVQMGVDVVYAFFEIQNFSSQIVGLWRNNSNLYVSNFVSYFIVLNITNYSDKIAIIEEFEIAVAKEILVYNGTNAIGSEELREKMSHSPQTGFSVAMENTIVKDFHDVSRYYPGWSRYIAPKESRLIGLTGMIEVSNIAAYDALHSGDVYLFARVRGKPLDEGSSSTVFCLKHVQLQGIGNSLLYNIVLCEDEMWRMDTNGLDVYIEKRR